MRRVFYVVCSSEGLPDGFRVCRCLDYPTALSVLRSLLDCDDPKIVWVRIDVAVELQEGRT